MNQGSQLKLIKVGEYNLTNLQYKPIWNCHNEFPLHNKYILIKFSLKKMEKKKKNYFEPKKKVGEYKSE
jgi:hypothetical protein